MHVNGAIIAMSYTHFIRIINNNNNRPPACTSFSYGTGNKVSRNDGLIIRIIYKRVFRVVVNTNVPIFRGLQTRNGEYTKHCTRSRHQLKMAAPAEVSKRRSNFRIRQLIFKKNAIITLPQSDL